MSLEEFLILSPHKCSQIHSDGNLQLSVICAKAYSPTCYGVWSQVLVAQN